MLSVRYLFVRELLVILPTGCVESPGTEAVTMADAQLLVNTKQVFTLNPPVNLGERGHASVTDLKAVKCHCSPAVRNW